MNNMASRFKDFGKGKALENAEPITFKLHDEEFTAVPEIQGALLIDLVKASDSDKPAESAAVIVEFLSSVLVDESLVRFQALVTSKDRIVDIETLGEITGWLVEEYTNRPEEQREA